MRIYRPFVLAALLGAPQAGAQNLEIPKSAALEWTNLRLVVSPIAGNVFLWTGTGSLYKPPHQSQGFEGFFEPEETLTWTSDVRWLLDQTPEASDTSTSYTSATLNGPCGTIYIVRRKVEGDWNKDQFVVLRTGRDAPLILKTSDRNIRDILDSLDAVARRIPAASAKQEVAAHEIIDLFRIAPEQFASVATNVPLPYPEEERRTSHEGLVLLAFVVGANGKADMSTAEVFHATSREFLSSVLTTLPRMRFNPARSKGKPLPQRVLMPFLFALYR